MEKTRGFEVCKGYEDKEINLPKRQSAHAVGYDIEAAEDTLIPSLFTAIRNNDSSKIKPTLIKTGIKAYYSEDEVLYLFNRSRSTVKKGLVLEITYNEALEIKNDLYNRILRDGVFL